MTLSVLLALAVLLELAAGVSLAAVAGLSRVQHVLTHFKAVHLIRVLFTQPGRWGYAWLGMALFWVMEAFTVWAGLAASGYWMNGADVFVGFATGTVFTRRTGPLAGAGILTAVLPAAIWYYGAPFAIAIAGVAAYRVLAFWLPMPVSLAALPTLRRMNAATHWGERAYG